MPSTSTKSATFSIIFVVSGWSSPVSLCISKAIGTPQDLCLDIHQSGRSSSIELILALPHVGAQLTESTES